MVPRKRSAGRAAPAAAAARSSALARSAGSNPAARAASPSGVSWSMLPSRPPTPGAVPTSGLRGGAVSKAPPDVPTASIGSLSPSLDVLLHRHRG